MYGDRIKFIVIIVLCVIVFAIFAFFGYQIIGQGKSFGEIFTGIKNTAATSENSESNVPQDNVVEETTIPNGFDVSELKVYEDNKLSGTKAKELLNIILQKYLANVSNAQKKDTSIILLLSNNESTDQNHLKSMKSLIDTYIYVVLGKNPIKETYRVYFEQDPSGDQKLRIIDNKDALDTIN